MTIKTNQTKFFFAQRSLANCWKQYCCHAFLKRNPNQLFQVDEEGSLISIYSFKVDNRNTRTVCEN